MPKLKGSLLWLLFDHASTIQDREETENSPVRGQGGDLTNTLLVGRR